MNLGEYLLERPLLEEVGALSRRTSRQSYQHDLSVALFSAGGLHLAVMTLALFLGLLVNTEEVVVPEGTVGARRYIDEFSIKRRASKPPALDLRPVIKPPVPTPPSDGVFIPVVKDTLVAEFLPPSTPEAPGPSGLFPDGDWEGGFGSEGEGTGKGSGGHGPGGVGVGEVYPSPDTLIIVEVNPQMVESPAADYPELARMAGIEGRVIVRVLVGKDGKVKKTITIESAHKWLEDAALSAARRTVFKPAIQQGHPVSVWVTIPFRFSLRATDRR